MLSLIQRNHDKKTICNDDHNDQYVKCSNLLGILTFFFTFRCEQCVLLDTVLARIKLLIEDSANIPNHLLNNLILLMFGRNINYELYIKKQQEIISLNNLMKKVWVDICYFLHFVCLLLNNFFWLTVFKINLNKN